MARDARVPSPILRKRWKRDSRKSLRGMLGVGGATGLTVRESGDGSQESGRRQREHTAQSILQGKDRASRNRAVHLSGLYLWLVGKVCERAAALRFQPEAKEDGVSRRQRAESQCRDCQADILWATQSTGGRVPLNLEPEEITATSRGPVFLLDELEMIFNK